MKESLKRIIDANIDGQPLEDYMCDLLSELDRKEVEIDKLTVKIGVLKQINNRHNNLNVSYKYELMERMERPSLSEGHLPRGGGEAALGERIRN